MFSRLKTPTAEGYSPLFFLSALGSGGLAISFFMYLMFWVPHPNGPIPTFSDIAALMQNGPLWLQVTAVAAMIGIIVFGLNFFRMFSWNMKSYNLFRKTDAFNTFKRSNAETQLMAIPLAAAMGVNVAFIFGAVFVPGLWGFKEFLFPLAILAFAYIGYLGFRIYMDFFSRAMMNGGIDCSKNNNLSQILPAFAFAMIGVGFAASVAMSDVAITVAIAMVGAIFFTATAVVLAAIKLVLGFRAMFENGVADEGLPTLLIMIPLLTIVGISLLRISHGTHVLEGFGETHSHFVWLTAFASIQALFAVMGFALKRRMNYFGKFITGDAKSPSSFALICPGVAGFVMLNFWLNIGLLSVLPNDVFAKFDIAYFVFYVPMIYLQYKTIRLYGLLNRKMLSQDDPSKPVNAKTA